MLGSSSGAVLPPPASSADWGTREVEEEADWGGGEEAADWGGGGGEEAADWELGFRSAFIPRQKKRRFSATPTRRFHLTASWPRNLVPPHVTEQCQPARSERRNYRIGRSQ
jgi:hypothetical protein